MKKKISVVSILILIIFVSAGCKKYSPVALKDRATSTVTVTLCMDASSEAYDGQRLYEDIQREVIKMGLPIKLDLIPLPQNTAERDAKISAIQTEIMAGGGPDIFLLSCYDPFSFPQQNELFANPQKVMNTNVFLPLDEWIAKSETIHMDQYNSVIMNAGKTKNGRFILPLNYSLPITIFDASTLKMPNSLKMTLQEIALCHDISLQQGIRDAFVWNSTSLFSAFADYETGQLLVEKSKLLNTMKLLCNLSQDSFNGTEGILCHSLDSYSAIAQALLKKNADPAYVALYNDANGITATITQYVAINRNAQNPEYAFKIVELLLSDKFQHGNGALYKHGGALSTNDAVFETIVNQFGYVNGAEFEDREIKTEDLIEIRSFYHDINAANFRTDSEEDLLALYESCLNQTNAEIERLVNEKYDKMRMRAAE